MKSNEKKQFYAILVLLLFVGSSIAYALSFFLPEENSIHWHARPLINICNKNLDLPQNVGSGIMHTENDGLIHIEGILKDKSQITLGAFFNSIGTKFSKDSIANYKNGDTCPNGKSGSLNVLVNGERIEDPENYVLKNGDNILIDFS